MIDTPGIFGTHIYIQGKLDSNDLATRHLITDISDSFMANSCERFTSSFSKDYPEFQRPSPLYNR